MSRINIKIDIYNQDWSKLLKKGAFRGFNINQVANADLNDITYRANSKRALISFGKTSLNLNKIAKGEQPWSFSRLVHRIKLSCSDDYRVAFEDKIANLAAVIQEKLKIDKVTTPEGSVELPLIKAVEEGNLEQVTALINSGANYDIQNEQGQTPLMLALGHKHFHIAHALLDVKAKVNIKDNKGSTLLMYAAQSGDLELFEKILSKDPKINKTNKEGLTALAYAASEGHLKICERLIELGAEVDLGQTSDGDTALISAVSGGHHEIVKKLIEKGADVNAMNKEQFTPLIKTTIRQDLEMIRILLENGANVNASVKGVSPLIHAVRIGSLEIATILIDAGADVNAVNEETGCSVLVEAVIRQKAPLELLELLMERGADLNYLFPEKTILDQIKQNRPANYREVRDLLKSRGTHLTVRNKEFKNRKQLGNAWHLYGTSVLNKKNGEVGLGNISLDSSRSPMWFHQWKKNLSQLELSYPGLLEDLNTFEDALDFGANQTDFSDVVVLQRIKEGLPTFINTGYKGHAVTFLIWGDQLLICNRGGASRRSLESYHFDQITLTLEVVNKIRNTLKGEEEGYTQLLTSLAEICTQTEQDLQLENALILQDQMVGNCSWVSAITAVCGMLLLAGVKGANEEERAFCIQTQIDLYRTWIGFQQISSIEQMMKLIPEGVSPYLPDHDLIQRALKSAHLTAWDEILTAKLDAATEIYVQSLTDTEREAFQIKLEEWKAERLINPREIRL